MVSLVDWISNGGEVTARQFIKLPKNEQDEIISFFENLPLYFELEDYILSHSGLNLNGLDMSWNEAKEMQTKDDFIWSRKEFYMNKGLNDKVVIFGHTPGIGGTLGVWLDPYYKDKLCIDCGAAYGGYLGCFNIDTKNFIYI